MDLMKPLQESMKRRAASYSAHQDDDDLFVQLLASQLKQLPAHQKIMVKMEINSIIYCTLLSSSSHGLATHETPHRNMPSNHGITASGIINQGVRLHHGIEESGTQYPPPVISSKIVHLEKKYPFVEFD